MPIAPIQTSQPNCHCPLEGSPSRKVCCTAKYNLGPPQPAGWAIRYVAASQRHCEQSEAIHSFFMPRHGLLRFARNDGWTYLRLLAALVARGLHLRLPPWRTEGAGKTGCLLHPRSRVRFALTKLHTSIQGSGNTPAFPAQGSVLGPKPQLNQLCAVAVFTFVSRSAADRLRQETWGHIDVYRALWRV
jgi:hypothetical protein